MKTGQLCEVAIIGHLVGIILAYPFSRVASVISLVASLLSWPFLLYFIAAGAYRAVSRDEFSDALQSNFVWSKWSLEPAIAVLIVVYVLRLECVLGPRQKQHDPQPLD